MNSIPQASIKSLLLSCLFSIVLAIIILLVAVLPAEYNIDLTGLGKKLGLTVLAQTSNSEPHVDVNTCVDSDSLDQSAWDDSVKITIPPNKGLEYKFHINKDEAFDFIWTTDGEKLYFDFHGEPQGDTTGYFKSFKISTENQSSGTLTVPFTGSHGWYWENKSNKAVVINLKTRGHYKTLGLR